MHCWLKGTHSGVVSNNANDTHLIGRVHSSGSVYYDTFPDPVHGGINMGRVGLMHNVTQGAAAGSGAVTRGVLRGLWEPYHRRSQMTGWANNDVFQGTGPLSGKTFEAFFMIGHADAWFIVETSDTWEAV